MIFKRADKNSSVRLEGVIRKSDSRIWMFSACFFLLIIYTGILPGYSQIPDSIQIVEEKPEKLLKKLRIHDITRGGFNFWDDRFSGHWSGIDFGFNGFDGESKTLSGSELLRSNSLYINLIQQSIGIQQTRNTIGLITGLGLQLKSYRLDSNTTLEKGSSGIITGKHLIFDSNQKSKFSMTYLTAPLLLEFQIPVNNYANRIFISGGLFGAYRLSSHTKIKYRTDRSKEKLKTPGDFSLNSFRYGLMVRLGYRSFQVFCNYDLQPMFTSQAQMPELYPVTFGITLLSF
jgi:hypothetical protein